MARKPEPATLSNVEPTAASAGRRASVTVVLECENPLRPSTRHVFDDQTALLVCRGARRQAKRSPGEVALDIADPWMSSAQARVFHRDGGWVVEDLGSKNGTCRNGQRVARAALADGDVLEVGRTLLVFRTEGWIDDTLDIDEDALDERVPGLRTLSAAFAADLIAIAKLARTLTPLLVTGETGTGKELVARAVHALSGRPGKQVSVNCGAIAHNLVESELFGHCRGAFSGATHDGVGLVRASDRGTLFLDEIGDLPLASQAALLRVVQEREVLPVGETSPRKVDLRVVAATNRDLDHQVTTGAFRHDLLARLAGARISIPPLRARREDIGLLLRAFLRAAGCGAGVRLTQRAARALVDHDWPLNIRELEQ
ncbi:MAG TPA: sigma 54-interacting transcriptional regulator, partial [Kofleriaceae bacterium]